MKIGKKINSDYFDDVVSGKKKFELRLNDFEVAEGDTLHLREWDPAKKEYTGREVEKKVSDVLKFKVDKLFWPKEEIEEKGLQVLSLEWHSSILQKARMMERMGNRGI